MIKYRTAFRMKSNIVCSSMRMVRKAYPAVNLSRTGDHSCTSASMDSSTSMPMAHTSRRLQSQRLAVAFKFCGYIYVVFV